MHGHPCPRWKISFTAYSGLVPMSPYTTPKAPSVTIARFLLVLSDMARASTRKAQETLCNPGLYAFFMRPAPMERIDIRHRSR